MIQYPFYSSNRKRFKFYKHFICMLKKATEEIYKTIKDIKNKHRA